jgi:dTDP-4-amino-4,6-dideoxygalactose transaminase
MSYFKPISISLSPNVEKDDANLALNLIIRPWLWKDGRAIKQLEDEFKKYLGVKYAVSFNSGRSSLYAILKALDLPYESDVLLQAFTCNASINPILWADLNPVYVDCNKDDYNINTEDLKIKVTPDSKVLMVQHTFGMPANMKEAAELAKRYNLTLIEDAAHALGAKYDGQKVGTFGKAAFFSFSRDKIISCVYGGMAVTNDDRIGKKLEEFQKEFAQPNIFWILQQLLHPILLRYFILPAYNLFDLGKIMLIFAQISHLLSKAVSWQEKRGRRPDYFPKALPNGLAILALNQFSKLEKFENQRKNIAQVYYKELANAGFKLPAKFEDRSPSWLRFTVQHKDAHEIIYEAWHKQNILIGDWYTTVIAPFDTNLKSMRYKPGTCPTAETLAKQTLNLPTHINISKEDLKRIIEFIKNYAGN